MKLGLWAYKKFPKIVEEYIESESMLQKLMVSLGIGLKELFFAPSSLCPGCFQEDRFRQGLGRNCLNRVMFITFPVCEKCGRPLRLQQVGRKLCEDCETGHWYFERARAVALYEGALREYLAELKYRYRPQLGEALGMLLVEWVSANRDFQKADMVIPIPLHPEKLVIRGYNQTELLASPLKRYLGMRISTDILVRDRFTEKQNVLNKKERFSNLKGAFRVIRSRSVAGKKILLLDDIRTTGATLSEAAETLLKAGANRVDALTLAAGLLENNWFME